MPTIPDLKAIITPNTQDALSRLLDGDSVSITLNSWGVIEWTLPRDLHLAGAFVLWRNFEVGDYGFFATINPASEYTLTAAPSGNTIVTPYAAYYDPTLYNAEVIIEFWDSSRTILNERRKVASVDIPSNTITLDSNISSSPQVDDIILASIVKYSTLRGTHNLEGGLPLIGNGQHFFGSIDEHELTDVVPAGLCHCLRIKCGATGSTRELACTFFNRVPSEAA